MRTRYLVLTGCACFTAACILAQVLPSTVPLASREHQVPAPIQGFSWMFSVNGQKFQAKITHEQIYDSPEWTPASSLPLTFAKAEEIARSELRKLVKDDSTWELTELSLRRLAEDDGSKWYYVVKLMPKRRGPGEIPDSFYLPISFSGTAGLVQVYGR